MRERESRGSTQCIPKKFDGPDQRSVRRAFPIRALLDHRLRPGGDPEIGYPASRDSRTGPPGEWHPNRSRHLEPWAWACMPISRISIITHSECSWSRLSGRVSEPWPAGVSMPPTGKTPCFIKHPKFLLQRGGIVVRINRQEGTAGSLWRRWKTRTPRLNTPR